MKASKYKNVYDNSMHRPNGHLTEYKWMAKIFASKTPSGKQFTKSYKTEIEAALAIDRKLISMGKEPVNILKPKLVKTKDFKQPEIQITGKIMGRDIKIRKTLSKLKVSQELLDDNEAISPIFKEMIDKSLIN